LRQFALDLLEKRVIEKFVSDCDLLALEKTLKQVVQTTILESRFKMGDLFFALGLELPKNGFGLLTLGAAEEPIED
jgi:hypothetical protein